MTWWIRPVGRVLDLFGIDTGLVRRWREDGLMRRYLDTMLAQNRVRVVDREVSGSIRTCRRHAAIAARK